MSCPCCGQSISTTEIRVDNNNIGVGWSDLVVRVTPTQGRIAKLLVRAAPGYVAPERMIESIYGMQEHEPVTADRALRVQVYHLRRALTRLGLAIPDSVPGVGYTLIRAGHRIIPMPSRRNLTMVAARVRAVAGGGA